MPEEESFKIVDRRGRTGDAASEPRIEPSATPAPPLETSAEARGERKPGLEDLFMMLAESALVNLGAEDAASGAVSRDLNEARAAIDLLLVLRDKTEGNRTAGESHLLEQLV